MITPVHCLPQSFQLTKTNEEIYKSLSQGLRTASSRQTGDYRHLVGGLILKLEFASYINRIISPPLRPVCNLRDPKILCSDRWVTWQVNSQVVRPEERELLSRLVDIMVALQLRFVQEKAEDGQLVYRLDPYEADYLSSEFLL
jgi:chromosome transmission fidelity protein 18